MIKTTVRAFAAAALALLPLATAPPAHAAETLSLHDGIEALPQAAESRDGYERTKFKHWVDEDKDGCNTRNEVLLSEAVTQPTIGVGCKITGGTWLSYYDDTSVEGPSGLDIDPAHRAQKFVTYRTTASCVTMDPPHQRSRGPLWANR
ncbi:hypothetical protein ACIPXV_27085 [Streptomyces libani]|uniref:hypothetical protein n=1 Tax=Streptomyces nigrescens TaxID=1920 RepID=UPI00381FC1E3